MKTSDTKRNSFGIGTIIACIGLIFSSILIFRSFDDAIFLDGLVGRSIDMHTKAGIRIMEINRTIQADDAIQRHEYEEALEFSSGNKAKDYYNRGVVQTLLAYDEGLTDNISGNDHARILLAQAEQNFDIAGGLSDSLALSQAIKRNQNTIDGVSTVIEIKSCYGIGQGIIIGIGGIMTTLEETKDTLDQERIAIGQKSARLPKECVKRLTEIVEKSTAQVGSLGFQMQSNINGYRNDIYERIDDPSICIDTPFENIIPSITKAEKGLDEYHKQHMNTLEALKSDDNEIMNQLCDQTKNDAQINKDIEDAIQELLQKFDDKIGDNEEKKKASNETEYKDFFDSNEKKTLEEINTMNRARIESILNIRGKGNYEPERYINEIFNEFNGNSGDFLNLHR